MYNNYLAVDKTHTSFGDIKRLLQQHQLISITMDAHNSIDACRQYLDNKLNNDDQLFYGINTGFGFLQNVKIDAAQLKELQSNLIKSHACGLGEEVPKEIVQLMMMLKVKSLSYGNSGVQIDTVRRLIDMYNKDVLPVIYTQGSLGAYCKGISTDFRKYQIKGMQISIFCFFGLFLCCLFIGKQWIVAPDNSEIRK